MVSRPLRCLKRAQQSIFKTITNNCNYHLWFTQMLKQSQRRCQVVHQITMIHTQKRIRSTKIAHMRMKWSAAMMISTPNLGNHIGVKVLSINSCTKCSKRLNTADQSFITNSIKISSWLTMKKKSFQKSTSCHICEKEYTKDDKCVRDHCHVTGK